MEDVRQRWTGMRWRGWGEGPLSVQRSILGSPGRERISWAAAAILDCDTPEEFLARVRED